MVGDKEVLPSDGNDTNMPSPEMFFSCFPMNWACNRLVLSPRPCYSLLIVLNAAVIQIGGQNTGQDLGEPHHSVQ